MITFFQSFEILSGIKVFESSRVTVQASISVWSSCLARRNSHMIASLSMLEKILEIASIFFDIHSSSYKSCPTLIHKRNALRAYAGPIHFLVVPTLHHQAERSLSISPSSFCCKEGIMICVEVLKIISTLCDVSLSRVRISSHSFVTFITLPHDIYVGTPETAAPGSS